MILHAIRTDTKPLDQLGSRDLRFGFHNFENNFLDGSQNFPQVGIEYKRNKRSAVSYGGIFPNGEIILLLTFVNFLSEYCKKGFHRLKIRVS